MEDTQEGDEDDRPPICPACGVTMGMIVDHDGTTRFVCLECGFTDSPTEKRFVAGGQRLRSIRG